MRLRILGRGWGEAKRRMAGLCGGKARKVDKLSVDRQLGSQVLYLRTNVKVHKCILSPQMYTLKECLLCENI